MIEPKSIRTSELSPTSVEQADRAHESVTGKRNVCLNAVRKQGWALQFVPEELKTPELCLAAVTQHAWALQFVPEELRTHEIFLAAVKQNVWTLQLVPEESMTGDIILAAALQYGKHSLYVPEKFRNPEPTHTRWRNVWRLQYIPDKFRTPEIFLAIVQVCGWALQDVPEAFITPELCLAAVQQSGWALQDVPEAFITPALCLVAVKQNGNALQHVPDEFRTPEICLAAVQQDGWVLVNYVPQVSRTPELILAAVRQIDSPASYFSNWFRMGVFRSRENMEKMMPADFDTATERALEIYQLAKLERPAVILRMDSPPAAMLGSALAVVLLKEEKKLHSLLQVCNSGLPEARERIISEVMNRVKARVIKHVCDPAWYFSPVWYLFGIVMDEEEEWDQGVLASWEIRTFLRQILDTEVGRHGGQIFEKVTSQILRQTERPAENPFTDQPGEDAYRFDIPVSEDMPRSDWRSFVSAFQDFGENRHAIFASFDLDEALACLCGDVWWHENVLALSDRPKEIHRDAEGRFHNDKGSSVLYRDGWGLYYWHGVAIPHEWVTGSPPSAAEALTWENMEQRRAACEIIGWKRILEELDAKVIDEDDDPEIGTLLEADIPVPGRVRFLKVRCGTGREFVLPVPPHLETALQANAWTWDVEDYEYRPEVRT